MKVLLVQSYVRDRDMLVYPLGLACLTAGLGGHTVRTLDLNVCDEPWGELSRVLGDFRPEAAGVSLRNLDSPFTKISYYEDFKRLVRQVRPHLPGPLIVGGRGLFAFCRRHYGRPAGDRFRGSGRGGTRPAGAARPARRPGADPVGVLPPGWRNPIQRRRRAPARAGLARSGRVCGRGLRPAKRRRGPGHRDQARLPAVLRLLSLRLSQRQGTAPQASGPGGGRGGTAGRGRGPAFHLRGFGLQPAPVPGRGRVPRTGPAGGCACPGRPG